MSGYREHRIRSSLSGKTAEPASDPRMVIDLAEQVHHANRGVFFTRDQLDAMPWQVCELIESEARRLYGKRRRR